MQRAHSNPQDLLLLEAIQNLLDNVDAKDLRSVVDKLYMEYITTSEDFQQDVGKDYHETHTPMIELFKFFNKLVDLDKQGGVLCLN